MYTIARYPLRSNRLHRETASIILNHRLLQNLRSGSRKSVITKIMKKEKTSIYYEDEKSPHFEMIKVVLLATFLVMVIIAADEDCNIGNGKHLIDIVDHDLPKLAGEWYPLYGYPEWYALSMKCWKGDFQNMPNGHLNATFHLYHVGSESRQSANTRISKDGKKTSIAYEDESPHFVIINIAFRTYPPTDEAVKAATLALEKQGLMKFSELFHTCDDETLYNS
ncbi:hypothetical protein C0J52_17299 [Blattella germanica]|nr:hypothetical protein C0J52_17299 [Blattella germanica]